MRTIQSLPVPDEVNSFWYYHDPNSQDVVVFVHGILSDSRGCWSSSSGVYWPELLIRDERIAQPSVYLGGYTTFPGSGDLRINDCARELFDDLLLEDGSGRPAPFTAPSITFVCHSTGGIVVRYMLERHQKDFSAKKIGLVLLASPSLGSDEANKLDSLLTFYNQQLGRQLQTGSESLFDIDNRFRDVIHKRLLNIEGVEAYEHYFVLRNRLPQWLRDWIPNWGRRVVQPFSAGVYFGAPKLMPRTDHFTIVKPEAITHPSHRMLVAFLQGIKKGALDDGRDHSPRPESRPREQIATPETPKPFITEARRPELWATLDRVRQEPHAEFGPALCTETSKRTVVVRRPDAVVTEVATLVNVSAESQGRCKFALFTDSPTQFKDMNLRVQAKIADVEFGPAVSHTSEGGHKFMIELGFRGNIVKPGGRVRLEYTARYPSSVALNEDYWVFTAETMRPGGHCEISVRFPTEPADIACYQISLGGKKEQIPVSGPYKERQEGLGEEFFEYRVTPDNPGGSSFVMTWRLENEL